LKQFEKKYLPLVSKKVNGKPPYIVFDVGAADYGGTDSSDAVAMIDGYGKDEIHAHAFEMQKKGADGLTAKLKGLYGEAAQGKAFTVHNMGVGGEIGTVKIW
jgi:hypothetical protein